MNTGKQPQGSGAGYRAYVASLTTAFGLWAVALAISPSYREDWALENLLLLVAVPLLIWIQRRVPLSPLSCTMVFIFLALHELGAHYTYSEVPYDAWIEALTGTTLSAVTGWERNHYDRLVHLCWGLLLTYPVRELLLRALARPSRLAYFLPVTILMASSTTYELIEWAAAMVFGGDLGMAYLGTQGDVWDAQKDELLAAIGAIVSMLLTALYARTTGRDPAYEWIGLTSPRG